MRSRISIPHPSEGSLRRTTFDRIRHLRSNLPIVYISIDHLSRSFFENDRTLEYFLRIRLVFELISCSTLSVQVSILFEVYSLGVRVTRRVTELLLPCLSQYLQYCSSRTNPIRSSFIEPFRFLRILRASFARISKCSHILRYLFY